MRPRTPSSSTKPPATGWTGAAGAAAAAAAAGRGRRRRRRRWRRPRPPAAGRRRRGAPRRPGRRPSRSGVTSVPVRTSTPSVEDPPGQRVGERAQAAAQVPAAERLLDVRDGERARPVPGAGRSRCRSRTGRAACAAAGRAGSAGRAAQRAAGRDRAQVADPAGLPGQVAHAVRPATRGTGRGPPPRSARRGRPGRRQSAPRRPARRRRRSGRWSPPGRPAVSSPVPSAKR